MLKKLLNHKLLPISRGQSLVEMAITAPILIFLLIGVFEVGWSLRGYLVLVNVNREITRFAVRPGYLDFSTEADIDASYERVRDWVFTTLSDQLPLDFDDTDGNATLIVSHLVVDTGLPCEDITDDDCDVCDDFVDDPSHPTFTYDDIIIHPGLDGHEIQAQSFGPAVSATGRPRVTNFDYEALAAEMAANNNKFNCEIIKKGGVPSANNAIVTELFFDQPQLFGFPLISNPFTDPVPLYTHTTMRVIGGARSTGGVEGSLTSNIDTMGPICITLPFTVRDTAIDTSGTAFDIMAGANPELGSGNERGFLAWDPQWQNVTDLELEFRHPPTAFNSYANVHDPSDQGLSVGDHVKSLPGNNNSTEIRDHIDALIASNQTVVIPVWDDWDSSTSSYRISTFIRVRLVSNPAYHLTTNNPEVWAVYEEEATECLP